jgi:hypothetical protein
MVAHLDPAFRDALARSADDNLVMASGPFPILRDALERLALNSAEQRAALAGTADPDELALDLENAVVSLAYAERVTGVQLSPGLRHAIADLYALFDGRGPGDAVWDDTALDDHAVWAEARARARQLLRELPV